MSDCQSCERQMAAIETWAGIAAAKHRPDEKRGGCECGFCAWSVEHVAIMSVRDALDALVLDHGNDNNGPVRRQDTP
jgi:hypothetical protein